MPGPAPLPTPFFAPQARLVDADTNNVISQQVGDTPQTANVDLVSAKVTLSINNVCQLQVVLNNQRHKGGLPVFPPWKYNDLTQIKFGQRLRLDLRYGAESWHKMIVARVTDLQFSFPQSGVSQLTIIGEDLLSLLKTKSKKEKTYSNHKEDFIVREVLTRSKAADLQLSFIGTTPSTDPLKGPLVPWPQLQPLRSVTHPKETSYLQFLQGIAERMDFEMFVDFVDRLILDSEGQGPNKSTVTLHFEPARSIVKPDKPLAITWGTDLVDFTPKFKVWEQLTEATVAGTKHGTRARHTETIHATDKEVTKDLHADDSYSLGLGTAPVKLINAAHVRSNFLGKEGGEPDNSDSVSTTNLDADRLRLQAIARLRKSMRELLTAEASTIGRPDLRPGIHINIGGIYPPFDGLYYVTQTVHTFDTSGYHTQFSLRRPGMLDNTRYPLEDS